MYHPFICGPGNHYTKELTATTGAAVHVPPLSAQKDEIVVSGEKDGVHEACQKIMQIYEEKVWNSCLICYIQGSPRSQEMGR